MFLEKLKSEPVVVIGTITAIIEAVIVLLVAFGVGVSKEQAAAITGLVIVVGTTVSTILSRSRVTPVKPEE